MDPMPLEPILGRGGDRSVKNRNCVALEYSSSSSAASVNTKRIIDEPVTPVKNKRVRDEKICEERKQEVEDEEEKIGYSTPPRLNSSSSSKADPSPWCRSDQSKGCEDPRVLKKSLEFCYQGKITTTTCDAWHDSNLKVLDEIIINNKNFLKRKNAALLGIQFVYEHEGVVRLSPEFGINTLFVSGGKAVSDDLDLKLMTSGGRRFDAKTVYDFLASDDDPNHVTKYMRDAVLGYYAEATNTKLSAETVAARQKEANFSYHSPAKQMQSNKPSCHANSSFEIAYLHSEQAMLLMLIRKTDVLTPFLKTLPPGAIIHQATLLIASKNQMCRKCGACYYVAGSESGILTTTLENYIRKFKKKRFQIALNGLNVFTQVSGLNVFDNINLEHRLKQMQFANAPISDSRSFSPHVAQRCLLDQLPRKHRNEFEKKKMDIPKFLLPNDGDHK